MANGRKFTSYFNADSSGFKKGTDQMVQALEKANKELVNNQYRQKECNKVISDAQKEIKKLEKEEKEKGKLDEDQKKKLKDLNDTIESEKVKLAQLRTEQAGIKNTISELSKEISGNNQQWTTLKATIANLAADGLKLLARKLLEVGKNVIAVGEQFSSSMSEVGAISGATAEQMVRLVLKGTNKTFDSLQSDYKAEDYSFTILTNTFKKRTHQEWDKKYLLSFGLVTGTGILTNAEALFADDSPMWQSRLYCTRWDGKEKGDAINDAEFTGNVLMLLREAMNFVKSNTKRGWEKLPDGRKNKPEYAERAVLEAMVNHFIHRDYTVMGSEVHLDIYDDRLTVTSPGGMYNGMLIQNLDIADVSSERRNPILANVMAQLDYMEKRGSGLTRICNETKALEGYKDELKPVFKSTPTRFQTIIYATADTQNVGDHDGDMSETKLTERHSAPSNVTFLLYRSLVF